MKIDKWIVERNYKCPICDMGTCTLQNTTVDLGVYWGENISINCQEWKCDNCEDSFLTDMSDVVCEAAFCALKKYKENI